MKNHPKKKVFKIGRKSTVASAVILTLGQMTAVSSQCAMEFQKQNPHMFLGTYLDYGYKTKKFSHAHSGLQSDRKQKNSQITSNQVKSYTKPVQPYGRRKKNSLPPGTSGQVGLLKLPKK